MFDWDWGNLRKIRAHWISEQEVEQALSNNPILVLDQEVRGEIRYVYYGETDAGRELALVVTERNDKLRSDHGLRLGCRPAPRLSADEDGRCLSHEETDDARKRAPVQE
jgi:uncharacterized DUF497 family protein